MWSLAYLGAGAVLSAGGIVKPGGGVSTGVPVNASLVFLSLLLVQPARPSSSMLPTTNCPQFFMFFINTAPFVKKSNQDPKYER